MTKPPKNPDALAQLFHETYERLAPEYGYETRKESAKPWADVPENNKRLMIAVCEEVQKALSPKPSGGDAFTGDTSDGYHTFNELYEHRHILFLSVLTANIDRAWRSKMHDDGTMFDGWFVAGLKTVIGQATYHLPIRMWSLFDAIPELEKAPPFDGHTAEDTLKRLRDDAYFGHREKAALTPSPDYVMVPRSGTFTFSPCEEITLPDKEKTLIVTGTILLDAAPEREGS